MTKHRSKSRLWTPESVQAILDSVDEVDAGRAESLFQGSHLRAWYDPVEFHAMQNRRTKQSLSGALKGLSPAQASKAARDFSEDLKHSTLDHSIERFVDAILPLIIANYIPEIDDGRSDD